MCYRIGRGIAVRAVLPLLVAVLAAGCSVGMASRQLPGGLSLEMAGSRRADGTPIALVPVQVPDAYRKNVPRGVHIFSLTYWSRGLRCQALLDVPGGDRAYPLLVELHGGDIWASHSHYSGFPVNTPAYAAVASQPDAIVFLPNYGGYGPSQGDVGDGHDDFVDVMQGLAALRHVSGLRIKRDATYLSGASLGGIVALLVATRDPQVRAIGLLSPWPGAAVAMAWLEAQPTDLLTSNDLLTDIYLAQSCGPKLASTWCRENSVPYRDIRVPVLLVGGTRDPIIAPGMLRAMAQHLRRYDPQVALTFVPGGHAPETPRSWAVEQSWFKARGLDLE